MAKKQSGQVTNSRARFDYDLKDGLKVGLVLTGAETKALRLGRAHLRGAYVTIKNNELWLINASITPGNLVSADITVDETRMRKLLAKKREIKQLIEAKNQGLTIVPVKYFTGSRYIKLEIAAGRGKRKFDKRQTIRERDTQRTELKRIKTMR